jgi:hypothetical protein
LTGKIHPVIVLDFNGLRNPKKTAGAHRQFFFFNSEPLPPFPLDFLGKKDKKKVTLP